MTQKIRIILPTYNEKENLKMLVPKLFEVFRKNNLNADVLIVDDNSPDGTIELTKELGKKYSIKVIEREKKSGLGSAYIRGFKESLNNGKDVIFEMDADLSHDPEYIPDFIEKIQQGFEVVIGEREEVLGWNWYRKLVSWGGNFVGRMIAGVKINDLTTGFRAYKKEVLESINLDEINSNGYAFQLEMLARALSKEFEVGSVPIIFYEREKGKSKLSKWDIVEFFILAFKIRFGFV